MSQFAVDMILYTKIPKTPTKAIGGDELSQILGSLLRKQANKQTKPSSQPIKPPQTEKMFCVVPRSATDLLGTLFMAPTQTYLVTKSGNIDGFE